MDNGQTHLSSALSQLWLTKQRVIIIVNTNRPDFGSAPHPVSEHAHTWSYHVVDKRKAQASASRQ